MLCVAVLRLAYASCLGAEAAHMLQPPGGYSGEIFPQPFVFSRLPALLGGEIM